MEPIHKKLLLSSLVLLGIAGLSPPNALAQAAGDVTQIESFIRQTVQVIASLAGLIATGFFVVGGFNYIVSAGDPGPCKRPAGLWSSPA